MEKKRFHVLSSIKHFVLMDSMREQGMLTDAKFGEMMDYSTFEVVCTCDTVEMANKVADSLNRVESPADAVVIDRGGYQFTGIVTRIPIASECELSFAKPANFVSGSAPYCIYCGTANNDCVCWLVDLPLTPAKPEPAPSAFGDVEVHCSDCNMSVYRCKCMPLAPPPIGPGLAGSSICIAGNGEGTCMCIVCDCPF